MLVRSLSLVLALAVLVQPVWAVEHLTLRREGREQQASGRVLAEASDGVLLEAADGVLWSVTTEETVSRSSDDAPFKPLEAEATGRRLLADLPAGFDVYTTRHYVIAYNTSRAYAQWVGALFERLYSAFINYWSKRGFDLQDPEFPLVVVLFGSRDAYLAHARKELGPGADSIIGYYSLLTNRVTTFDLTGIEMQGGLGRGRAKGATINQLLNKPGAEKAVGTIIHEATHQIAYNCGLHTRFADIPLWVSEGLAVYFETPDLSSTKGWRTIGNVNHERLARFRQYQTQRGAGSLESLVATDARFRNTRTALDAYAEAWALNYFLIRQRPREYKEYVQKLAAKERLAIDEPDRRVSEFRDAFGDLKQLDREFLRYFEKLR
jgi:hypothetical protein